MTASKLHIFRRALGLVFLGFGFAWLFAETRSVVGHIEAHPTHLLVAGILIFAGGYLLNPPDAEAIADAIAKRIPVINSIWPGGSRRDDPPAQPGVPPPPSVTGAPDVGARPKLTDDDKGVI